MFDVWYLVEQSVACFPRHQRQHLLAQQAAGWKRKAFSQSDKDDKQGVDNDKYWPGMAERLYSTLWQLSVLVGKLLDPKSGAEPRSPDHNYHYLSKPIVWSFKKKIFKIQKRKWLLISKAHDFHSIDYYDRLTSPNPDCAPTLSFTILDVAFRSS